MATSNEAIGVQLLFDGDGLAVIGKPSEVERFLASEGLSTLSHLMPKIGAMIDGLGALSESASAAVETVSSLRDSANAIADSVSSIVKSVNAATDSVESVAETVGKWMKKSEEISKIVQKYRLSEGMTPGVMQAVVGQLATLTGAAAAAPALPVVVPAAVMLQMAMQQSLDEIKELIEAIDQKLNEVLKDLENEILSRVDGVRLAISEANTIRNTVGRVSETTWSKIQNSSGTILETQARALRELADLAKKFEILKNVTDLEKKFEKLNIVADLERKFEKLNIEVQKWLRVLADCFQLLDSIAVLEIDRVLDAAPEEIDKYRLGLKAARQQRLVLIANATKELLERMNDAAEMANSKVFFNPRQSKRVVKSSKVVTESIKRFEKVLGIESGMQGTDVRLWRDAASEGLEKAREMSSEGVKVVKQLGSDTREQAHSIKGKISEKISERSAQKDNEGEK
jgi:hypothetical protein